MQSVSRFSAATTVKTPCQRVALLVALIILALQLLLTSCHTHAIIEQTVDCGTCHYVANFRADVPSVKPLVLPAPNLPGYRIASPSTYFLMAYQNRLTPPSQAPPPVFPLLPSH